MLFNCNVPGLENSIGQIYVTEFQKRGPPIVYLLTTLERDNSIKEDKIREYIVSQIPNKNNSDDNEV